VSPPTLRDLLRAHPAMRMNIEAKSAAPRLAEALVQVIREAKAVERVCIGSQADEQGERLRRLLPEACHFLPEGPATCHVMAARAPASTGCPGGWDVADLPYRLEGTDLVVLDRPTIEGLHRAGLAVFAWTVDDEADMQRLLADGIDGVMTDRPDLLARVLGRS
jgi:glycerophosphoryl diester phosphodiesterase